MSDVRDYMSNFGQKQMKFTLHGLNVLDYMELYKKHTFVNQESYSLNHISHIENSKINIIPNGIDTIFFSPIITKKNI